VIDYDTDTELCCTCQPKVISSTTPAPTTPSISTSLSTLSLLSMFCCMLITRMYSIQHYNTSLTGANRQLSENDTLNVPTSIDRQQYSWPTTYSKLTSVIDLYVIDYPSVVLRSAARHNAEAEVYDSWMAVLYEMIFTGCQF